MFMKHLLAIDNDVINQRSLEHAIYVMRDVLQLPEEIISQIVELNCSRALSNALQAFINCDTQNIETPVTEYALIKNGLFTDVDSYCSYFNGYMMYEYDHYFKRKQADEVRDHVKKEFTAYCKIYDLISNYILSFAYYEDGKIKIYEYWR